ncbi:MAG TPA: recombinase family protein [Candidatus Saccharimonadales bacterium]|nr:recombinase family protein [Candidatus Saccharimonadales bacterium]
MQELTHLRFGLYARKSTESEDRQVQSIQDQKDEMKRIAKEQGFTIVRGATYWEAKSAKIPGKRDEYDKLIARVEAGELDGILSWKSNRLARNPKESGEIQQLMFDGKLKAIVTAHKTYLPEDNALIFSVDASMDAQFSRDLVVAVKRGMQSKADKGWLPGVPPIGYKNYRDDENSHYKTIILDEKRSPIIRQMWDMMMTGTYSVPEIARWAEKKGLRSIKRRKKGNKPMSTATVYAMFHNPFYNGYMRYNGKVIEGNHDAIVTPKEFERVQLLIKRYNQPRPEISETDEPDPFPYRGIIKCGECGCLITYSTVKKTYKNGTTQTFEYCYCTRRRTDVQCSQSRTIKPQELTKRIRKELDKYTILPEFFDWACKYLSEFHEEEIDRQEKIYVAQTKTILAVESELRELGRMRYKGQVDDEFYESEKLTLENKLTLLRGDFNTQEEHNKELRKLTDRYFNFARYAREDFESDEDEKRKEVLGMVGQNLTYKDGLLEFEPIKYLTPLVENYPALEKQYLSVQTQPQQMKKEAVASIISHWYPGQDSNLRP